MAVASAHRRDATSTTRSSSVAATTASSPRPTSARPACGRSSSSGARRSAAPPARPSSRPGRGCRPWPTRSAGCGRRSSATSTSSATGCRSSVRTSGSSRPARTATRSCCGATRRGPPRACATRSAADAERYAAFDRLVRTLAGFLGDIAGRGAAGHRIARSRRRPGRSPPRADVPWARAGRTAGRSPASCRWRSRTSWPSRSRRTRSRPPSRGAASSTRRWGRGRPGRRPCCWPMRPATTAARPGQTVYARGGPGALATALAAAATEAGVEIRTGAEVAHITSRDGRATGVVLADGEELSARAVVAGIDPKQALTRLADPVAVGPEPALAGGQHPDARHGRQGQPRAVRAAAVHGRGRRRAAAPRPDRHRARHRRHGAGARRGEVRPPVRARRSWRRRSRRWRTHRWSTARRPARTS